MNINFSESLKIPSTTQKKLTGKIFFNKIRPYKTKFFHNTKKPNNLSTLNGNFLIFNNVNLQKAITNRHLNSNIKSLHYSKSKNDYLKKEEEAKKGFTNETLKKDLYDSKIHSNGKFKEIMNIRSKIREQRKKDKQENIKNFSMNFPEIFQETNKISQNDFHNKIYRDLNGLNLSSHYIGNTFDNKFGITTNKFLFKKDLVLDSNLSNIQVDDFTSINIPKHGINCGFNGMTYFFHNIVKIQKNKKIYSKLLLPIKFFSRKKNKESFSEEKKKNKSSIIILSLDRDVIKKVKLKPKLNKIIHISKNSKLSF